MSRENRLNKRAKFHQQEGDLIILVLICGGGKEERFAIETFNDKYLMLSKFRIDGSIETFID